MKKYVSVLALGLLLGTFALFSTSVMAATRSSTDNYARELTELFSVYQLERCYSVAEEGNFARELVELHTTNQANNTSKGSYAKEQMQLFNYYEVDLCLSAAQVDSFGREIMELHTLGN